MYLTDSERAKKKKKISVLLFLEKFVAERPFLSLMIVITCLLNVNNLVK